MSSFFSGMVSLIEKTKTNYLTSPTNNADSGPPEVADSKSFVRQENPPNAPVYRTPNHQDSRKLAFPGEGLLGGKDKLRTEKVNEKVDDVQLLGRREKTKKKRSGSRRSNHSKGSKKMRNMMMMKELSVALDVEDYKKKPKAAEMESQQS